MILIRYVCDLDGCENFFDTEEVKLPLGWSCDPIYDEGKYTGKMAQVCTSCHEARTGKQVALKPVDKAKVQQARAKKRKAEFPKDDGQKALF